MESIFTKIQTNIILEKLKETSSGVFSIFVKKNRREVVDVKYQKSNLIMALKDGLIIIFDILSQKSIYEIEVINKFYFLK
jgi:hypothetical protein